MPPKIEKNKKVIAAESSSNSNKEEIIESNVEAAPSIPLASAADKPNKKKPGRPRKMSSSGCSEIIGITNTPISAENSMEMVYDNPILFKKIFSLLKAADVSDITLIFAREYIRILVKEEQSGNTIFINICVKYLNRYYLDERYDQIETLVKREGFERIFRRVNKNFNEVMFYIRKEDINSIINVRLMSKSGGLTKENEIEVYQRTVQTIPELPEDFNEVMRVLTDDSELSKENMENNINSNKAEPAACNKYYHGPISLDKFQVQFTLISKVFKSMIDEINNHKNSTFEVEKCGSTDKPLTISSVGMNKFRTVYTYDNPAIINLRTNLPNEEDEIFSTSLQVEKVRQFTNNIIGDTVDIAANNGEGGSIMRFISECDRRICISETGRRCEGFVCQLIIYCFS